ncbi:MAG: hypothetical protein DLM52_13210 [Chthoniobacterales bacterium]|nr:MAG: hypothetical protein DLM52_13210 [Chthoniobacterales bacterium]
MNGLDKLAGRFGCRRNPAKANSAMSRAFVKEDIDPPERSRRPRAASGLPPGAINYMTAEGAQRLRDEIKELGSDAATNAAQIAQMEELLASVTIVDIPADRQSIAFGAKVTVRDSTGAVQRYRIVGVDEIAFYPDAVSWISPIGKKLLAADVGDRITLVQDQRVEIAGVEYPELDSNHRPHKIS